MFDKLVNNMLSSNAGLRPDINEVISSILNVFSRVWKLNEDGFNSYL